MAVAFSGERLPYSPQQLHIIGVPFGAVISPFQADKSVTELDVHADDLERCSNCFAFLNADCDVLKRSWTCGLCGTSNASSERLSSSVRAGRRTNEAEHSDYDALLDRATVVHEVGAPRSLALESCVCICVDLAPDTAGVAAVSRAISDAFSTLPAHIMVSITAVTRQGDAYALLVSEKGVQARHVGGGALSGAVAREALFARAGECRAQLAEACDALSALAFRDAPSERSSRVGALLSDLIDLLGSGKSPLMGRCSVIGVTFTDKSAALCSKADGTSILERAILCGAAISIVAVRFGDEQAELRNIVRASVHTGGKLELIDRSDEDRLYNVLKNMISEEPFANVVVRVRSGTGAQVRKMFPRWGAADMSLDEDESVRSVPACSSHSSITVEFQHSQSAGYGADSDAVPGLQAAILYTRFVAADRKHHVERRLRVLAGYAAAAVSIESILSSLHVDEAFALVNHGLLDMVEEEGPASGINAAQAFLIRLVADYSCAVVRSGSVDVMFEQVPRCQPLLRLVYALTRHPLLRGAMDADVSLSDDRAAALAVLRNVPPRSVVSLVYPTLLECDEMWNVKGTPLRLSHTALEAHTRVLLYCVRHVFFWSASEDESDAPRTGSGGLEWVTGAAVTAGTAPTIRSLHGESGRLVLLPWMIEDADSQGYSLQSFLSFVAQEAENELAGSA